MQARAFAIFLPTYFVPDYVKGYLYSPDALGRKQLLVDRYEFLVYRLLRNGLEAGEVFCHDSVRFRSSEDDSLYEEQWQRGHLAGVRDRYACLPPPLPLSSLSPAGQMQPSTLLRPQG